MADMEHLNVALIQAARRLDMTPDQLNHVLMVYLEEAATALRGQKVTKLSAERRKQWEMPREGH